MAELANTNSTFRSGGNSFKGGKKMRGVKYIVVFALAAIVVGYGLGRAAGAGGLIPGSSEDPLASKSYVDTYFYSRYNDLREQVGQLTGQVETLEKRIASLPETSAAKIKLTIGSTTAFVGGSARTLDAPPVIYSGFTMLPLRFVGEALGAAFAYDAGTKTVTFSTAAHKIILVIGSGTAVIDGKEVKLDVPARTAADRTLVPLRFVSEALGADVSWDAGTKTVTITP